MKIRHPEKIKNPINPIKRKPDWIKSKLVNSKEFFTTKSLINKSKLVTFKDGKIDGIWTTWKYDGEKEIERFYKNGLMLKERSYTK